MTRSWDGSSRRVLAALLRRIDAQTGMDRGHPPSIERGDRVEGTPEMPSVGIDVHGGRQPRQNGRDVMRGVVEQAKSQRREQDALRQLEDADRDQGRRVAPSHVSGLRLRG